MGELNLGAAAEATVQAYKELASDPSKRFALSLDETCIQFLAYVIAEGTGTSVQSAVDTLQLLSDSPECRPSLAGTFGVLEALQEMADDARYSEELRNQATGLFTCLQFCRHVKPVRQTTNLSPSGVTRPEVYNQPEEQDKTKDVVGGPGHIKPSSLDTVDNSKNPGLSILAQGERSTIPEKKFLGPHNSKAKTVTLYIDGMINQKHRQKIEEELVRVRGLISIVFDLNKSRVTCRVKKSLTVDKLAAAIARTSTFEAQQVVLNNNTGDELVMKIGEDKSSEAPTPIEDLPDYLPEEEIPVKDSGTAMTTSSSLKDAASSFFSAASNLLQNSFYW